MVTGGNYVNAGVGLLQAQAYSVGVGLAQSNAVPRDSLNQSTLTLVERLTEIHQRLMKANDMIFGTMPRDVGASAGKPEPMPSLQRHIERAHSLLSDIQSELASIETRL